jgi:serine/threonine-protein kinase PknG
LEVLDAVPDTSSQYMAAQLAAIGTRLAVHTPTALSRNDIVTAGERLAMLELDPERRATASIEVLRAAHDWLRSSLAHTGSEHVTVLDCPFTDRDLRRGLEREYRALARLANDVGARREFVELANSVRPVTWV